MKTLFDVINICPLKVLNELKIINTTKINDINYRKDYEVKLEGSDFLFFQKLNVMKFDNNIINLEFSGKGTLNEYFSLINILLDIYGHDSEMSFRPKVNSNIKNGGLDYLWYLNDKNEVLKGGESNYFYAIILTFVNDECFLDVMNYHNLIYLH